MRVLMLNKDAVPGGTSRHVAELAAALAERGCALDIVMPAGGHAHEVSEIPGCRVLRPRSLGRALSTELAPGAAWQAAVRDADLVHLHLPNPVGLAAVALARRRPLVVTFHCEMDRTFGIAGTLYRALMRHVMIRADRVIVTSEPLRATPSLDHASCRVAVVPLGVDPTPWNAAGDAARANGARAPFVLFVGRLAYYKGLDVLVRAAALGPWPIHIAGDGPERPRLERLVGELRVADRVQWLGHRSLDELPALVAASRCLVLPSTGIGESFSQALIEAAHTGRPAIATTLPTGVPWVNLHGETGLNVPPGDERALAQAIHTLCTDLPLAERLGEAARARASREFTTALMADRTLALYREVLAERAPHAGRR